MLISKPNLCLEVTASAPLAVKLALLGTLGGTHIGGSFARGAAKLGIKSIWFDADTGRGWFRGCCARCPGIWRTGGRLHLNRFSNELVKACARAKPDILIATGMAPLTEFGAARVATIGHCQRELFDRRSLESGHAVELAPAGIALL